MDEARNNTGDPCHQPVETGSGDYTAERQRWLAKLTFDDVMRDIERMRQGDSTSGA
jgi:hypothetical protein